MPSCVRGHVGQHDISLAAKRRDDPGKSVGAEEIELRESNAGNRFHVDKVDRRNPTFAGLCLDTLGRVLRPAARRGAQIDNSLPSLEEPVSLVDFLQLIDRARTLTLSLR